MILRLSAGGSSCSTCTAHALSCARFGRHLASSESAPASFRRMFISSLSDCPSTSESTGSPLSRRSGSTFLCTAVKSFSCA
eukprot:2349123-Pyramimonas_sp.AAC.1